MSSHAPAAPDLPQPAGPTSPVATEPAVKLTRAGALWTSLIFGFLILILLLTFVAQNIKDTPFTFLGFHWTLPLGVAILLAAIAGGLLTFAVGTARILQLRRAAKKHHKAAIATAQPGVTEL